MNHRQSNKTGSLVAVIAIGFALIGFLFAANWNITSAQDTYGTDRRPTYRKTDNERRINDQLQVQHFRSGAQQSEVILQQILEVLQRMDRRIENLERIADTMHRAAPNNRNLPQVPGRAR